MTVKTEYCSMPKDNYLILWYQIDSLHYDFDHIMKTPNKASIQDYHYYSKYFLTFFLSSIDSD